MSSRAIAVVAFVLGLAACQQNNRLSGYPAEAVDLEFDEVRAYVRGPELVIAYVREYEPGTVTNRAGGPLVNHPVRLSINTQRVALVAGETIAFAGPDFVDMPAGSVDRFVVEEDIDGKLLQTDNFARVVEASIRFDELGLGRGKRIAGRFDCEFDDVRGLSGRFDVELEAP